MIIFDLFEDNDHYFSFLNHLNFLQNLDAIDNLSEVIGMIQKVKLEFIPNEVSKEI